jgi:hypothetical protein
VARGFAHVHGEVHLCCIYQYGNLEEIADRIKDKMFDPASVFEFNAWLHREEPFDLQTHEAMREELEEGWRQRWADPSHNGMSTTPAYIAVDRAVYEARMCRS